MLGKTLAHYEIESQLGKGGMGVVYLARDTKLDREVAIKFLSPELTSDEVAHERFIREAKAAAAIQHESICAIHEIGETDTGQIYIVMPKYEGRTLKDIIAEGPLGPLRAMSIAEQIGGGLSAAHSKGVIHRDIKPGNIVVDAKGRIKILDFGLAKLSGQLDLTKADSSVGTVPYMAPEQLLGKSIDQRTDIWALGALVYEMLTGRRAFEGEYEQAVSYSIVNVEPVPPHEIVDGIPAGVENIVMKCLAKEPGKRYQSVNEFLSDVDIPTSARQMTSTTLSRLVHKNVSLQAGTFAGIFGAVCVVFVLAFILFGRSSQTESLKNRHLAILPFTFIGEPGDSDTEAFSYGLMETLTSSLSRLQGTAQSLWVIPSSEVNDSMTLDDARRQLKADLVVGGSIQMEGQRVRVNLTLSDAKSKRLITSDGFDYTGSGTFAVQDEAVVRLLAMLGLTETTDAQIAAVGAASAVPSANDALLKAKGYLRNQQTVDEIDIAIGLLSSAIQDDSLFASAYATLGLAYWEKYRKTKDPRWVDDAILYSQKALDLDSQLAEVHITLGAINLGLADYAAAVDDYQRALEIDPLNSEAYRNQESALRRLGRMDEAKASIDRSIELAPEYWRGYYGLALHHYSQKEYDKAIRASTIGLSLAPESLNLLNIEGASLFGQGNLASAVERFDQLNELYPEYLDAWNNGATCRFYLGDFDAAVSLFEHVVEQTPNDFIVRGYLADAYHWSTDRRDRADETYRKAIELGRQQLAVSDMNPETYASIGGYFAHIQEADSAISYLNRALSLFPDDPPPDAAFAVGELYATLGDLNIAKTWLETGLSQDAGWAQLQYSPWLAEIRNDVDFMERMSLYKQ